MNSVSDLVSVVKELSLCRDLARVMVIVRTEARRLTGADGVTFVLREEDCCFYADEDAIAPLWKGSRFPMSACISGWVMIHGTPAVIDDIYADPRIPADAYRPTFVKSLAMVPVRREKPVAAIGAYWAGNHRATDDELTILQTLADSAALALENVTVYGDLARALAREQEARCEAERLNQLKDEFLAILSHELRTPLNSIVGWLRVLEAGAADELQAARGMAALDRNVTRLRRLIDDLLEASRIVTGKLTLSLAPCRVAPIIEEALEALSAVVDEKQMRVKLDLDAAVQVNGDPDRLAQVCANLLGNALKFTPRGGDIAVTLRRHDRRAILTVADTGVGIPADVAPHIFERFRQGDSSTTRQHGGLGLGLAIVKHLVDLHGGGVRGDNRVDGPGAVFTVDLPAIP